MSYPVLAPVSEGYPKVQGRLLTCYSPVRRSSTPKGLSARLACVKHAASVRPEPGSNSPTKFGKLNPDNQRKLPKKPPKKGEITWHWLIKHPVEFSRNKRTPRPVLHQGGLGKRGNFPTLPDRFTLVKLRSRDSPGLRSPHPQRHT